MIGLARRTGMRPRAEVSSRSPAPRTRLAVLSGLALAAVMAVGGCAGSPADQTGSTPSAGPTPSEGGSLVTAPGDPSVSPSSGAPSGGGPANPGDPIGPGDPAGPGKPPGNPATRPPAKEGPGPSGPFAAMTLTGTVTAGVEPNCFLLDNYLLIGGPRDVIRPGARISVVGRPEPDLMTTCQQGTPFRVESARPA